MSLAVFALVASPLLAFLGVLLGHRVTRCGAVELDRLRKREEAMRLLRWSTELAIDPDPRRRLVGVEVVAALARAPLLDGEDAQLVSAVFDAVASRSIVEYDERRPP